MPTPGQTVPDLTVDLVGGGSFKLADADPENFKMVVFYRGHHCPVCKGYNQNLSRLQDDYAKHGVDIVAVSMDDQATATATVDDWDIDDLDVGYGLTEASAREWGLFISSAINDGEPDRFSEPGLFLVRPDGTLYYSAVNSMPFGRPNLDDMVQALDFVLGKDYPARGVA